MESRMSDEDLWSIVDRGGATLADHLARHPEDSPRVDDLRGAIGAAANALGVVALPTPERIGSYRIEREIGRGGGGVVYEAWQENPPRRVALKVLRDGDRADAGALARFRREAEALGRLSHPHIASIFEAGRTSDGHPFLAMELVHGSTLTDFARAHAPDVRKRVELFRDACDALHHAHRQGVIHRDLKPTNVLVDKELGVKVVDFGLARMRDAGGMSATNNGIVLGTLGYMSPEQARGDHERIDERADVYSLGVVLYELLVGAPPFDLRGKSSLDAVRTICETRPTLPRSRDATLERDLETIVLKAIEKEPEQRYGSAAALAEDLGCWLAGRPILARRPSVAYRMRKLAARNKLAAAMLGVLLVLALLAAYAATFKPRLLHLGADWYAAVTPFEGMRWIGDKPEVELDGKWYQLLQIDGLNTEYVIAFCKQEDSRLWRKRFSEDLLQALNLMGDWPVFGVDLVLREPDTGRVVERRGVALEHKKRQAILRDRNAWPFEPSARVGDGVVQFGGREWTAVSVDGVRVDALEPDERSALLRGNYDRYCDLVGRSPGARMRLELRDPATGDVSVFEDVDREPRK
jgi:hypothetical protein